MWDRRFRLSGLKLPPPATGGNAGPTWHWSSMEGFSGLQRWRAKTASATRLFADQMRAGVVVFLTDEFNQVCIGHQAVVHRDGPRFGVSLRIVDRDFRHQVSVIDAAHALDDFAR